LRAYGIFTKPIHVEKIVNYLNNYTTLDYCVSTEKYEHRAFEFKVGVSYCFPYKVDANDGHTWYNYHPAPLPDFPGATNYADAINKNIEEYGVTLHLMTEEIDRGTILKVVRFPLESIPVNSNELGSITHYKLFQLFKNTIEFLQYCPKTEEELNKLMEEKKRW